MNTQQPLKMVNIKKKYSRLWWIKYIINNEIGDRMSFFTFSFQKNKKINVSSCLG